MVEVILDDCSFPLIDDATFDIIYEYMIAPYKISNFPKFS